MKTSRFIGLGLFALVLFAAPPAGAGTLSADFGITISDGAVAAISGTSVTYTITASNGGPSDATNSSIASTFDAALTCSWTCSASPGSSCTAAGAGDIGDTVNLLNGGNATYTAACDIAPSATGTLSSSASVTVDAIVTDPVPANNSALDDDTVLGAEADLGITKTGPATATAGGQATYTIEVTNTGPSDATLVSVTDTPPAGFTFASATAPCAGGFPCDLGTMAPTDVISFDVIFDIDPSITGSADNIANVSSATTDPNGANDSDTASTTVNAEADLGITKTGPATATAGGQATYTIEVTSTGPSDATLVSVTDTPPAGFTFASATAPCAGGFPCDLGTMAPTDVISFDVIFDIDPSITGSADNIANVSSATTDPNGANDSDTASTTVNAEADLGITKTGPATATAGGQATYTIEVTSTGPSDATVVSVTDTPPAGFTFASATAPCAGGFPCDLGTMAPTDVISFDVIFDIDPAATGTLDNTASVSSAATDPNAANDSDVASTTIGAEADLSITKTDNETLIDPGDSVTYTIVASNAGPSAAPDAVIADVFELPLINCSWSSIAAGGATGNGSGSGDINEVVNMPPGSSVTYTAICGTLITSGPVTNTATISSASVTDPDGTNDAGVDADTFLGEIRAIPTLGHWGLLLLLGLIATVGLVRIRAST